MNRDEQLAHLRLIRTPNIGPMTFSLLIQRYGNAVEALRVVPDLARRGGRDLKPASKSAVEKELAAVEVAGATLLFKGGDGYLDRLAQKLSEQLSEHGYVVVSGLASGIDAAAHNGALAGGTIAVIAGGIDFYYPSENADLQDAIIEAGLLLAEMPPGTQPTPRHFPIRNRIIASLAQGVLVVEAAQRSGSLITARKAGGRGGEVMAVPGSPLDARAQGCNHLIREGATLVRDAEDIVMPVATGHSHPARPVRLARGTSYTRYPGRN